MLLFININNMYNQFLKHFLRKWKKGYCEWTSHLFIELSNSGQHLTSKIWEIGPKWIFIVLLHHSLIFLSIPRIFYKAYKDGKHFVDKGSKLRMQLLLFIYFFRRLGNVSKKTKRIKLLNLTFPQLTPTPIHKHGHDTSFSTRRAASCSN